MKLFELFATLVLETSEFDRGVEGSESKWNTFGEKLSGGLSKVGNMAKSLYSNTFGGNLGAWIRDIADEASAAGDKIDKQSQALGMSRRAYQEWDYILGQSGASIDSLGTSMKTLNSAVLSDSKETREVFEDLGLSMSELNGLTQESQFEKVVRAFQQLPAGAEKSALAVKLFGRNGQDLLPLLNSSSDSIDEMRAECEELGIIMSDDMIDASVNYQDALDKMNRTFTASKQVIGAEFLPVLTNMFTKVANFTGELLNAYKEGGVGAVVSKAFEKIGNFSMNIDFPTWGEIKDRTASWWNDDIKPFLANMLVAVFGIEAEDAESVLDTIKTLWDAIEGTVEGLFSVIFSVLTGDWQGAGSAISSWWSDKVWPLIQNLFSAMFGIEIPSWEDVVNNISDWWENAKSGLGSVLSWALGLFNMPSLSEAVNKIQNWWHGVRASLNLELPDPELGSAVHTSPSGRQFGGGGRSFATGLDYVPYNDFSANLHEGEAVLTKAEASEWRRGDGTQSGVDLSSIGDIVEAAIARGMRGFGFYVDGQRLADATSEPISRNIAAAAVTGRHAL